MIKIEKKMAKQLTVAVGISSGANIPGAIQPQQYPGEKRVVVTEFSGSNKKYPGTHFMKQEPVKREYLSPGIQLYPVARAYKNMIDVF